jgi:hypothetical protein
MSTNLFAGTAPPNVNTTQTSTTAAPQYYNDFLTNLANLGTNQTNPDQTLQGNIAAGQPYVAPLNQLQSDIYGTPSGVANTESLLSSGLTPFSTAAETAGTAAQGVGSNQINNFLNPYISDVNKALETSTQQNVNQTVLPALQAFGAGSGNTGSSRLLNATGQTLGQIQQGLGAQESANLASGFNTAATDALQNQANLTGAANSLSNIGTGQEQATVSGLNTQNTLGAAGQAQTQAMINAPLSTATNVSNLLKGYTVPTSTNQTYTGPASTYGPSPLAQIAGLGTLFASGSNGTSAAQGIANALGLGSSSTDPNALLTALNQGVTGAGTQLGSGANTSVLNGQLSGQQVTYDPTSGTYVDSNNQPVDMSDYYE